MTRKVHLTGKIKPSTRNAVLDQLAAIADGIIERRERALLVADRLRELGAELTREINRRWWHRFAWRRK